MLAAAVACWQRLSSRCCRLALLPARLGAGRRARGALVLCRQRLHFWACICGPGCISAVRASCCCAIPTRCISSCALFVPGVFSRGRIWSAALMLAMWLVPSRLPAQRDWPARVSVPRPCALVQALLSLSIPGWRGASTPVPAVVGLSVVGVPALPLGAQRHWLPFSSSSSASRVACRARLA